MKDLAYSTNVDEDGYSLVLVKRDRAGYYRLNAQPPEMLGVTTWAEAEEVAHRINKREFGLTEAEAHDIVWSSLVQQSKEDNPVDQETMVQRLSDAFTAEELLRLLDYDTLGHLYDNTLGDFAQ